MPFGHERLDVYQRALDFLVIASEIIEALPRGRSHLVDQLSRASTSIVLNIAEGAGKFSPGDKRRYDLSAAGSGTECAAVLDVLLRLKLLGPQARERERVRDRSVREVAAAQHLGLIADSLLLGRCCSRIGRLGR